ncbi:TonB-dependent receptor domain-containing protein [Dawidia soli]|uniref:TonB-dependent receptor n=1 Tax=Dawidia soli TaxID=2782352 RepID=A0AAP2DAQ9_9BACT|nr:TonB-dependent receptor [Dawidia soli]MBT1687165.1 TonB-dependent receptor [Dawidia soli]
MERPIPTHYTLVFLLLTLFSTQAYAQDRHTLTGRITSPAGEPQMGNALALSVRDSSLLRGVSFLEGDFTIADLPQHEVLLKLTSIQFGDTILYVSLAGRPRVDLGTVVVHDNPELLGEVEITGDAPLFTTRPDGVLQINVTNTVLATSNSVQEILTRSPNVISDENGGLSVFGRGQAILYLNGKRITPERLASVSAAQVKSIEIITNPPASYDAEGQAVINIITKADLPDGYRATVNQQVTWSEYAGGATTTQLNANAKKGRIDLAGNFDLRRGNDRQVLNTTRTRPADTDYLNSQLRWDSQRDYANVSNYSLGMSYALRGGGYASVEYNGFYERIDDDLQSRNFITTHTEDSRYSSRTARMNLTRNNAVTINSKTMLDTLGSYLFLGGQFSAYSWYRDDDIHENNRINNEEFTRVLGSSQNNPIKILSPQADFVHVYPRGGRLAAGAKLSHARVAADLSFYEVAEGGEHIPDAQRTNDFSYDETISAAYTQYDGVINKSTTFGVGLRAEWTRYALYTSIREQGTLRDTYVNLFPQAQIAVTASPDLKLRAAYTSRIIRPSYQSLSPALIYQDAFTSSAGNPDLKPEKVHALEVGVAWRMLDLKAGYSYSITPLSGGAIRGADDKSYVLKAINLGHGYSYFATVSATFSRPWLTSTNSASASYTKSVDSDNGFTTLAIRPQVYLYTNNKINVGKLFSLQLLGWYLGQRSRGLYFDYDRWLVTLGAEKEFLNKALKVSFTANDIYHTSYPAGHYNVNQTHIIYQRTFNTDYYRFIITYTFGQLKKSTYQSQSTGTTENSRVR